MNLIKYLIPISLIFFNLVLIKYDANKATKNKHVNWLSRYLHTDHFGINPSFLHQTIVGFLFVFCIGIGILFIIGLIEK